MASRPASRPIPRGGAPGAGVRRWPAQSTSPATGARTLPALSRRSALTHAPLGLFVAAAAWLAIGSARGDYLVEIPGPLPVWIDGPLHALGQDIGGLPATQLSALLILMFVSYVIVLASSGRIAPRAAWTAIILTHALFVLAPTLVSSDAFGYIAYARLGALHGLNPYLHPPASVPHDPLLPFVYWRHATSPYGPLFTIASYPLALISPEAALWALKAIAGLTGIALALVTARAAHARGHDPLRAALLVGLNPVLLVYTLSGAHNDLQATLLVALAIGLASTRHESHAASALVAAAAVKITAGLALPFLIVGARQPRRALLAAIGTATATTALAIALFGPHLVDQLQRITTNAHFDTASSGPDRLGQLFGGGITSTLRTVCAVSAVLLASTQLARTLRGSDWVAAAGWATLALMASIASFAPWYIVWLLIPAALAHSRALRITTLILTGYILAVHLPLLGGVPWLSPALAGTQ